MTQDVLDLQARLENRLLDSQVLARPLKDLLSQQRKGHLSRPLKGQLSDLMSRQLKDLLLHLLPHPVTLEAEIQNALRQHPDLQHSPRHTFLLTPLHIQ